MRWKAGVIPRVLVDIVFKVHQMQQTNPGERNRQFSAIKLPPGCLLVHCSAGVGRTGTFLTLYKLWMDYMVTEKVPI